MKRIIGILLVIAALGSVLLGVKAGDAAPANKKILENAVMVSDGQVLPENEGNIVIVTDVMKAPLPFTDEETGIQLNSIVAYRKVEKLAIKEGDEENPDTWIWEFTGMEKDYGGSRKLIAPNVTFGEFKLSEELMMSLSANQKVDDYSDMDLSAAGFNRFREDGTVYLYAGESMPKNEEEIRTTDLLGRTDLSYRELVGTLRVYYQEMADSTMEYTIIARQNNGNLEAADELKMTHVISGHMTREELLSYADSSAASAKNAAWITAGVLAVLGILMIIKGGKKPEKQTKA